MEVILVYTLTFSVVTSFHTSLYFVTDPDGLE